MFNSANVFCLMGVRNTVDLVGFQDLYFMSVVISCYIKLHVYKKGDDMYNSKSTQRA